MAANPKAVADYKSGKAAAANAIKGAVMRETKGSVRADVVERVLKEELDKPWFRPETGAICGRRRPAPAHCAPGAG